MHNDKSRVLFVAPLPPPVHGSSVVSKQIKDSKLINNAFRCDFVNISISRRMNEIGMFPIVKIGRYFGAYFCMLWKLLSHRYDLTYLAITVNGVGFLKDWPFAITARLLSRSHVIHQHNKGVDCYAERWPYNWMLRSCYKNSKVILLSWRLYADISKVVSKEQVMVCHNGLSTPTVIVNRDEVVGARPNAIPQMLFLSNLIESKGVYVLLDACKMLNEKGILFRCVVVGSVSKQISKESFEQSIRERGLEECVEYVGPKYGDEKEAYWREASIFVFPSFYYNECFPLVVLEAMQHSLPVVASNEAGIPDMVEDGKNGYLVDAQVLRDNSCHETLGSSTTKEERETSRQFNATRGAETARVLERLLTNPSLRCQMGAAGYERYKRLFTQELFERKMLRCLKESLKS